jgi:type I restriction enzyme S subunit
MSDDLLDLPEGWKLVKLEDILSIKSGEAFKKKDYSLSGIKLLQIANVSFGKVIWEQQNFLPEDFLYKYPDLVLNVNDVVMALNRPIINDNLKIALLNESDAPAILYQRVASFNLSVKDMRKYFFYYANSPSFIKLIYNNLQGTDQPYINTSTLPNLPIPLPPLNEQKRIVAKIEELSDRSQAAQKALETIPQLCDRFRQSVLAAAFRGDLTADWREKNPDVEPASVLLERIKKERCEKWENEELKKFKASGKIPKDDKWKEKYKEPQELEKIDNVELSELPDGWLWMSADKCTSWITDGEHATPERSDSGVYLLSARNVLDGKISLQKVDFISEQVHKKLEERLKIESGDVFLSCSGTVGRSCVVPPDLKCSLVRSVAVLKPLFNMGEYLSLAIRSPCIQAQIEGKKTQTAQSNIFQGRIKILAIPVAPLNEQKQIVSALRYLLC